MMDTDARHRNLVYAKLLREVLDLPLLKVYGWPGQSWTESTENAAEADTIDIDAFLELRARIAGTLPALLTSSQDAAI